MAKSYVKYETPKDVAIKALEALTVANDSGKVRKGANETTKSIESGMAKLVLIASDVEPEEVVMHLPEVCREKEVPFVFIATKKEIGEACSIPVPCAACSIEKPGNGTEMLSSVCAKVTPLCGIIPVSGAKKEEKPVAKKEEKSAKKEEKPKEKKEKKAKKASRKKSKEEGKKEEKKSEKKPETKKDDKSKEEKKEKAAEAKKE